MSNTRLDAILTRLARKHVPYLLNTPAADESRLRLLAGALAKEGVLVLMGVLPDDLTATKEAHVNAWISTYGSLYVLLAGALFPSLTGVNAVYADNLLPPVIVMEGSCSAVMAVFAGYVVPYIAARQNAATMSEAELRGVMMMVLDELEGRDLPPARYNQVCNDGIAFLRHLLQGKVDTISLTDFARPIFQELKTPPPPKPPALPPDVPEANRVEKMKTQEMFVTQVPIFFKPPPGKNQPGKPRPPVLPPGGNKPDTK
jgi:hypothetical protein